MILTNRRLLLGLAGALPLSRLARAATDLGCAAEFIRETGNELVAAINSPEPLPKRRDRVATTLRQRVDMERVGRFILGRWWREATPQEQQEYLHLFEETLIRNLSARFGEFQGVRFNLGRTQQQTDDDALINMIVERPNSPIVTLDWRISSAGGQLKIVDLIAEGTSLRLTLRSEYAAVMQRNNGSVPALLAAMRNQIQILATRER